MVFPVLMFGFLSKEGNKGFEISMQGKNKDLSLYQDQRYSHILKKNNGFIFNKKT